MSGFVLDGGMGEDFYHLKLPVIQEDGAPLWEHKDTIEDLQVQRKADPRTFAGQMQQDPSPDDGTFFKEWFKRFEIGAEPELVKYGCADYAVTEEADGDPDFTEIGVGGFDIDENLWIVDWWHGKTSTDKWIEEEDVLCGRHELMLIAAEVGLFEEL